MPLVGGFVAHKWPVGARLTIVSSGRHDVIKGLSIANEGGVEVQLNRVSTYAVVDVATGFSGRGANRSVPTLFVRPSRLWNRERRRAFRPGLRDLTHVPRRR